MIQTYYTSGGFTSGIDVALRVVADLEGEMVTRKIQRAIEYVLTCPRKSSPPVMGDRREHGWDWDSEAAQAGGGRGQAPAG